MELQEEAGGCKGKIGKRGNKVLIESWATEETCKAACLEEKGCKFATLRMKGKPSKWQCASYKKCKLKKNQKHVTFKKSKAKAPKPSPKPSPKPGTVPELPDVAPLRDAKTGRPLFSLFMNQQCPTGSPYKKGCYFEETDRLDRSNFWGSV